MERRQQKKHQKNPTAAEMQTEEDADGDGQQGKKGKKFPPLGGESGQPGEAQAGGSQDDGREREPGKLSINDTDQAEHFSRHG